MSSGFVQTYSHITPDSVKGRTSGSHYAFKRKLIPLVVVAAASLMTIATAFAAQIAAASAAQNLGQSTSNVIAYPSTQTADAQSSIHNPENYKLAAAVPVPVSHATDAPASLSLRLSNAQMSRMAGMLLGLTYFVMPVGIGFGLFLYDRHQAERTATLEAQIKLLEKIWKKTPQA